MFGIDETTSTLKRNMIYVELGVFININAFNIILQRCVFTTFMKKKFA